MTKAEQAAKMRAEGKSIDEIMSHFGWSEKTTKRLILIGRNYPAFRASQTAADRIRHAERSAAWQRHKDDIARRNRHIAALIASGMTKQEVAKQVGLRPGGVASVCHRHKIVASNSPEAIAKRNAIRAKAQVQAWADADHRIARIASIRKAKAFAE